MNDPTFQEHLNRYDVIFLNMQQFLIEADSEQVIQYLEQEVLRELREEYGEIIARQDIRLAAALREIFAKADRQFIFLIDEWDCVMRERQESEILQKQYLDFLRNLLKDQPYVALAYMTGILPVKKYGLHSALNMFWEYSMTNQYIFEEYTGFTEDEVKALCKRFDMDFDKASSWYDGYRFRKFKHIYNPRSVVSAMSCQDFSSYWTATETYDALKAYIDMDFGYFGYDAETKEAFIPNKEIIREFENAMSTGGWSEIMRIFKASEQLLADTLSGDEESVAEGLDRAHTEAASILTYNDENSRSLPDELSGKSMVAAIGLAYYSARKDYRLIRELPTGRGFADIVFLPLPSAGKPAIVVELKYDQTADTAIRQIKDRHYTQALEGYIGEILLVGMGYDRENKNRPHSCVIEKLEKQ